MKLTRRVFFSALAAFGLGGSGCASILTPIRSSIKLAIKLNDSKREVFSTTHWYGALKPDQKYLGSCTFRLTRVEGSFGGLTKEEWLEFLEVVRVMEAAAKARFGASHLNWSCLMNHGYRTWPAPVPLVHVHFHPRYMQKEVTFAGLVFTDEDPASHYKPYTMRSVPEEVEEAIIRAYREEIFRFPNIMLES